MSVAFTLQKMVCANPKEQWEISLKVYEHATNLNKKLETLGIAAPKLLGHGPKSIVFTWETEVENFYITITETSYSLFISTPDKIVRFKPSLTLGAKLMKEFLAALPRNVTVAAIEAQTDRAS